jgi:hypothetical protein
MYENDKQEAKQWKSQDYVSRVYVQAFTGVNWYFYGGKYKVVCVVKSTSSCSSVIPQL